MCFSQSAVAGEWKQDDAWKSEPSPLPERDSQRVTWENTPAPIGIGALFEMPTSVDGGGEVSRLLLKVDAGVPLFRSDRSRAVLSVDYRFYGYDFDNVFREEGVGIDWDEVHEFTLSLPLITERNLWLILANPSLQFSGEGDASLEDTISGGLIAGAAYRITENLRMGPGFGVFSQIEDQVSLFPILFLDWQITDRLSLTTRPTKGAVDGPGFTLDYSLDDEWTLQFSGQYDSLRFRLEDGRVGEDRGVNALASVVWRPSRSWEVKGTMGTSLASELHLEDGGGNEIDEAAKDPSLFFGLRVGYRF